MTKAGVTHDIVVHISNTQEVGLIARMMSYRVTTVPKFAPQFSVGNQAAVDKSWLRSFKYTFARGAGLPKTDDPNVAEQFAEGLLVTVTPEGALLPSALPTQTSSYNNAPINLTSSRSVQMFTMSQAPRLVAESLGLFTYTDQAWVVTHTDMNNVNATLKPLSAVMHSGVAFMSFENSVIGVYGNTGANPAARMYQPVFGNSQAIAMSYTQAHQLYNYDKRLWKTLNHRIANWDASQVKWSSFIEVGEATTPIRNTETFIGRKFFGKDDGLWVYDAGRVYQIEDYTSETNPFNFGLLRAYRGALYFNIGRRLLRYTAGGAIEEIPWFGGLIKGGVQGTGVLYIWAVDLHEPGDTIWAFNPDTGAVTSVVNPSRTMRSASAAWDHALTLFSPALVGGEASIWIGPTVLSSAADTAFISPITKLRSGYSPWQALQPNPFVTANTIVSLPETNFGIPGLVKSIVRVKAFYEMQLGQSFQVLYKPRGLPPVAPVLTYTGTPTTNYPGMAERSGNQFGDITQNLIIACKTPFSNLFIDLVQSGEEDWSSVWEYESTTGWKTLNLNQSIVFSFEIYDKDGVPQIWIAYNLSWNIPIDWLLSSTYGADSYHIRKLTPWGGLTVNPLMNGVQAALSAAFSTDYSLLGTVVDTGTEAAELEFDPPVQSESLSLQLRMFGSRGARPKVKAIEVEYTVPDSDKLQVSCIVVGTQPIKLLNGAYENSAQWVATTLFSMWQSGKPFPVQLPFPFPVAHTRNMVITIQNPGVTIPVLAYSHSFIGGEYSLLLREI